MNILEGSAAAAASGIVASAAAVAAAARVFVFSKAFLGALGFSQILFNLLWSHRAFSNFLGFPVLLGILRVPLGTFGSPRTKPRP